MNKINLIKLSSSEILRLTELVFNGFSNEPNPQFKEIGKINLPIVKDPEYNLSYVIDANYMYIDRHSSGLAEISCWSPYYYGPKIFKTFHFSKVTDITFIELIVKEIYSEMLDILLNFSLSKALCVIDYAIKFSDQDPLPGNYSPYRDDIYYREVCPGIINFPKLFSEQQEFLENKFGVKGLKFDKPCITWLRFNDDKVEKEKRELWDNREIWGFCGDGYVLSYLFDSELEEY